MIELSAAGLALIVIVIALAKGEVGRVGMVALVVMGTALGFAADIRAVVVNIASTLTSVANTIGGAF